MSNEDVRCLGTPVEQFGSHGGTCGIGTVAIGGCECELIHELDGTCDILDDWWK